MYVNDLSVRGVLDGLRAGHTFVSAEPPAYGGARLYLRADGDHDGRYESLAGDTVRHNARFRVRVVGAPGAFVRIVGDGEFSETYCKNRIAMQALGSPIYVGGRH